MAHEMGEAPRMEDRAWRTPETKLGRKEQKVILGGTTRRKWEDGSLGREA